MFGNKKTEDNSQLMAMVQQLLEKNEKAQAAVVREEPVNPVSMKSDEVEKPEYSELDVLVAIFKTLESHTPLIQTLADYFENRKKVKAEK